jgi:hypothetical protein
LNFTTLDAAAREKWSSSLPSILVPLTPDLDDGEERRGRTAARPERERERERGGHGVVKGRGRIGGGSGLRQREVRDEKP